MPELMDELRELYRPECLRADCILIGEHVGRILALAESGRITRQQALNYGVESNNLLEGICIADLAKPGWCMAERSGLIAFIMTEERTTNDRY